MVRVCNSERCAPRWSAWQNELCGHPVLRERDHRRMSCARQGRLVENGPGPAPGTAVKATTYPIIPATAAASPCDAEVRVVGQPAGTDHEHQDLQYRLLIAVRTTMGNRNRGSWVRERRQTSTAVLNSAAPLRSRRSRGPRPASPSRRRSRRRARAMRRVGRTGAGGTGHRRRGP